METKSKNGCRRIGLIILSCIGIIFVLAVICHQPLINYLLVIERNKSWKGEIQDYLYSLELALPEPDYTYSIMILRSIKTLAEFLNMQREEYLEILSTARKSIPETIDTDRLPYDLRQENESQILYGLCSTGGLRLEGLEREEELDRLAAEFEMLRSSGSKRRFKDQIYIVWRMYALRRLTDEDIKYVEIQSGCDIMDATGNRVQ